MSVAALRFRGWVHHAVPDEIARTAPVALCGAKPQKLDFWERGAAVTCERCLRKLKARAVEKE